MSSVDDFALIPSDDGLSAQDQLDAAVASVLEQFPATPVGAAPVPFGRTPLFDFETGRMVRRGGVATGATGGELFPDPGLFPGPDLYPGAGAATLVSPGAPVWVTGHDALTQWVLLTIYTARFAHRVFTDAAGMELPDSIIGEVVGIDAAVADWGVRLEEALTTHDRISSVENYEASYDGDAGIVYVTNFDVVTDEGETISFGPLSVAPLDLLGA